MENKKSIIRGTAILMMANGISKILGAVFKIPVANILKEEGMAVFQTAMGVYTTVLSIIISGFPIAVTKIISKEYALKNFRNIKKITRISTVIFCLFGIVGSAVLFFFAKFFAYSMKDIKSVYAIRAISPCVFFVSWGMVYKCYFQGMINMIPTAISQIIEAIVKLLLGILFSLALYGYSVEIMSSGTILGITVSEIISTLVLFFLFITSKKSLTNIGKEQRSLEIVKTLFSVAFIMFICTTISSVLGLLDVSIVRNSLVKINFSDKSAVIFLRNYSSYTDCFDKILIQKKLSQNGARWLYGAYSGYALTIINLPIGITAAVSASVMPIISGKITNNDLTSAKNFANLSLKYTMMIASLSACGLLLFSREILRFLFNNTASSNILSAMSFSIIFICVSQLFCSILHAEGKIIEPFVFSFVGLIIKILCDFFLIRNPYLNIFGTVIGTTLGFATQAILLLISIKKSIKVKFGVIECVLKPIFCSVLATVTMRLLILPINSYILNFRIAFLVCGFVGMVTYLLSILSFGVLEVGKIKKSGL